MFKTRIPTRDKLDTCPHSHTTNTSSWDLYIVDISNMRQISKAGMTSRVVFKVRKATVYTLPSDISPNVQNAFTYNDQALDE